MTQCEAAEKMGVTARVGPQARQADEEARRHGGGPRVAGALSDTTQRQALTILKKPDWHDFGPTLAANS
jgi:hypothetical protein